jgi:uncharacterized protein YjbJ (UPF0337 family)
MSDASKDRLEGTVKEGAGRAKSAVGDLTGNSKTQASGQRDQATGQAQQGMAGIKEKIDGLIKRFTGGNKSR